MAREVCGQHNGDQIPYAVYSANPPTGYERYNVYCWGPSGYERVTYTLNSVNHPVSAGGGGSVCGWFADG
jgi:hypothetical protein